MAKNINETDLLCPICKYNFITDNYNVIDNTYYCPECEMKFSRCDRKPQMTINEIAITIDKEIKNGINRHNKNVKNLNKVKKQLKNGEKLVFNKKEKGIQNDNLIDALKFMGAK